MSKTGRYTRKSRYNKNNNSNNCSNSNNNNNNNKTMMMRMEMKILITTIAARTTVTRVKMIEILIITAYLLVSFFLNLSRVAVV